MDWNDYSYFSESEFVCRCGCGRADMDTHFIKLLQQIRSASGIPMIITSGFRCDEHNKKVGGGPTHPMGRAADVAVFGSDARKITLFSLLWGITGIGWKQQGPRSGRFIHLDNLTAQEAAAIGIVRPWVWSYSGR